MCFFTSVGYFRACEVTGNTWHTHQVFSISESLFGRYHYVFQHSFLSVSERDEWMNLCSQQDCLGGMDIPYRHPPHRCCQTSTLKLLIFHLPVLHTKYHALEGSRVRWGITISNLPFTLPLLQKPSSKTLALTTTLLWFIRAVFLRDQILQHHALMLVCSFSAPWSISSDVGDQEGPHHRAVVWYCWCTVRGWGIHGLLFHSAVHAQRSFQWSLCNPWVSKAPAWCLLASWGPKPWHCLSPHVVSGADELNITYILLSWKILQS